MAAMDIGFIGLGQMGAPMAANLVAGGHRLVVHDPNVDAVARLVALGAASATTPADAARDVEVVITMLPTSGIVDEVLFGPDGVASTISTAAIVVDMSTSHPFDSDRMRERLAPVAFVDAPVGRTSDHAVTGTLVVLAGATDGQLARLRPVFECVASEIMDCGGSGTGIRTKIVNNAMSIALDALSAEIVAFAERLGLDLTTTLEVFAGTPAGRGHFATTWPDKVLAGDLSPNFTIDLAHKDLTIALDVADRLGFAMPAAAGAHDDFTNARDAGRGSQDWSAILEAVRERPEQQ